MIYPKWVQRTQDLGPILATNEEEETRYAAMGREPAPEPEADPNESDEQGHTVESARAALDAAGIPYKKTFGLARLIALLPA